MTRLLPTGPHHVTFNSPSLKPYSAPRACPSLVVPLASASDRASLMPEVVPPPVVIVAADPLVAGLSQVSPLLGSLLF